MPRQNNLLMDFNPTPQQGSPFAEQLTNPYQSQRQPSGYQGKAGDSFMLASKFLEGIQEGKLAKYHREETEIAQKRSALGSYVEEKMNDPDLPDAAKREIGKHWHNWINSTIATSDTGKEERDKPQGIKGHLVNFIKDFAKAQLGGNIPKHKEIDKPENVMFAIEQNLRNKPEWRSKTAQAQEIMEGIQKQADALGQNATQEDRLRVAGPGLDKLQVLIPDRVDSFRKNLISGYQSVPGGPPETILLQDPKNPQNMIAAEIDPRTNRRVRHGTGEPLGPEFNGWIQRPPGFQPRPEQYKEVQHPDGTVTYEPIPDAKHQEAPTRHLEKIEGEGGKTILERPGAAVHKTTPPPTARGGPQMQQHAINQFEKIREQKTAAWAKANTWYDNAMKAVKMKDATAAGLLGIPTQGASTAWDQIAQWIEQEAGPGGKNKDGTERPLGRQQRAAQDAYMEGIGQTNQLYYPQQGTAAPPGDIDEEGYSTGPGTSPPPATGADKPWTAEEIKAFRRK